MTESSRTRSSSRTRATLRGDSRSARRVGGSRGGADLISGETPSHWFPVWAPVLVMLAVIFTGLVLAKGDTTIPTSFFALFAVAMIVSTIFVEPRGLFLSVASYPLYYLFGSLLIGWFSSGAATIASRKTKVITSIYPAIEHFLWLLFPFLIAVIIAVFRWWNYRESLTRQAARLEMQRRRRSESDRSNVEAYGRAKQRSQARSQVYRDSRDDTDAYRGEPSRGSTSRASESHSAAARHSESRGAETRRTEPRRTEPRSTESRSPVTRSSEQLRNSAQRRRVPFPERRVSPRHFLDDERD